MNWLPAFFILLAIDAVSLVALYTCALFAPLGWQDEAGWHAGHPDGGNQ